MNFFEHQDRARKRTGKLVVLFVLSVILIVVAVNAAVYGISRIAGTYERYGRDAAPVLRGDREYPGQFTRNDLFQGPGIFIGATAITLLIIVGGTLYKTAMLSGGGESLAQSLGGRPINPTAGHAEEQMLQNIVEEMSIASGVPVPRVYVLENEDGINAFAAGFTTQDAVIGVTRGAMTKLNRDELQGVMAHEFSHILNGDMRLNIRLIGLLHGILVISVIGMIVMRSLSYTRYSTRRSSGKNSGGVILVLLLGAALYVIGSVGLLFGRLIQAAVSRQREFLADASAVQFTRNPSGIANALKKLGGYSSGSRIVSPQASGAAHMFFGSVMGMSFSNLLATHPPLAERIKAIDPMFDGNFEHLGQKSDLLERFGGGAVSGFAAGQRMKVPPQSVVDAVGGVSPQHLRFAAGLISSIPETIADAARDPFTSRAVVFALLADHEPDVREKQLSLVRQNVEKPLYEQLAGFVPRIDMLGEGARLPLLDLCMPALRRLSPQQSAKFRSIVRAMIQADGRVTLFEYALNRIIEKQLISPDIRQSAPIEFFATAAVREEAAMLLSALAAASTVNTDRAFQAGARQFDAGTTMTMRSFDGLGAVDAALQKLARSSPAVKRRIIDAAAHAVAADGEVNVAEAELLRATAATLDVPLPPMLAGK